MLQDPVLRPPYELDTSALEDLLPEIPMWVKNPSYDRVSISFQSFSDRICSLLFWFLARSILFTLLFTLFNI